MTREQACEHMAVLMNEWFQTGDETGSPYTAESIEETLRRVEADESQIGASTNWYPVFTMTILERSGALR